MVELSHIILTLYAQSKTKKNASHKQCNVECFVDPLMILISSTNSPS
jgi:hypothetical protein